MSVTSNVSGNNKVVDINVSGHFDFSVQKEFRDAYRDCDQPGMKFNVVLSKVEYMDSAALGMLMVLKKHADSNTGQVILKSPSAVINKILLTSKFDKLFTIEA